MHIFVSVDFRTFLMFFTSKNPAISVKMDFGAFLRQFFFFLQAVFKVKVQNHAIPLYASPVYPILA